MKVSIITVNFNQPEVTAELLGSIPLSNNLEVIVVDNGSDTDSSELLRKRFPNVNFLRSPVNLGFAGGNNLGINAALGDYLFLVNNDTEFTPGLVEKLTEVLDKHPSVAMVSPKIKYFQNKQLIQYAGYTLINYYTGRNNCIGFKELDSGQYDNYTGPTGYCHGAAMMVKKTAIERAGLMNENFFLYYEEVDWCEKIKRAGYETWIDTTALIYHKESVSVGKKAKLKLYFMNRNRMLLVRRNATFFKRMVFYVYFSVFVLLRNILRFIKEKDYAFIPVMLRALWWNITHSKTSKHLGFPV